MFSKNTYKNYLGLCLCELPMSMPYLIMSTFFSISYWVRKLQKVQALVFSAFIHSWWSKYAWRYKKVKRYTIQILKEKEVSRKKYKTRKGKGGNAAFLYMRVWDANEKSVRDTLEFHSFFSRLRDRGGTKLALNEV